MIDNLEIDALMESTAVVVREYVSAEVSKMATRITTEILQQIHERLKEIPAGHQGPQGANGLDGPPGQPGPAGERGEPGAPGTPGVKGDKGETGTPGESIQGPKGETGEQGTPGPTGDRGPQGLAGQDGHPGESIRGDQGEPGPMGPQGVPGPHGEPGSPGVKGDTGDRGPSGANGLDAKDGRDGRDGSHGKDGRDGEHGRDALQIDILSGIDESKAYQRGTFACHKGGTVYFNGREWLCVSRGIDFETDELSEDFRTRTRKTFYTDGTVKEYSWRIPAMLYREGFKDGTEYTRGDVVNYDNSSWICVVESTKAKPFPPSLSDKPQDWRLMVRKGGNGKDGAPGIQGPPGKDLTPANGSGRR